MNILSPLPHYIKYFPRMKEIFRSVALLVPEGLRGYNGQKLILNLEPNTVCGREGGGVMCKTYDEMIIKWAGRNSRQRRGSSEVSLVTCRAGGRGEVWETTGPSQISHGNETNLQSSKMFLSTPTR